MRKAILQQSETGMSTRTTFLFSAALMASSSAFVGAGAAETPAAPEAQDIPYCSELPPCSAVTDCLLGSPDAAPAPKADNEDEQA